MTDDNCPPGIEAVYSLDSRAEISSSRTGTRQEEPRFLDSRCCDCSLRDRLPGSQSEASGKLIFVRGFRSSKVST
jgi:hypothetical protein